MIGITEDQARAIVEGEDDRYEVGEESEWIHYDNGARWGVCVKRIEDGATFLVMVGMENENVHYASALIPIEFTDVQVTHRVWHEPGRFTQPKKYEDCDALLSKHGDFV